MKSAFKYLISALVAAALVFVCVWGSGWVYAYLRSAELQLPAAAELRRIPMCSSVRRWR